ncbi:MAG: nicotinate-nucleotide--dimethylbenzimidazole phosphoribosyltransferase [Butyrivibrio sp.]|nr:nicotinate-nucleotide--dimethylbenzimidazole phosphoribosyltransferase [Butyrivibrio sp.]
MRTEELLSLKTKQPDGAVKKLSKEKWDHVAKPIDGLGIMEDVISSIASMKGKVSFSLDKKALIIMCADNGVVDEGVTQTDKKVTLDVATLMGKRKSSVGVMTAHYPLDIFTYDIGMDCDEAPEGVIDKKVKRGTEDFLKAPAMSEKECLEAIYAGIEAVKGCCDKDYGIIATGEMGIGNTTTSTALMCGLLGLEPEEYVGKGSGLTDKALEQKKKVIKEGLRIHGFEKRQSIITDKKEVLRSLGCLGGLDIAGLAGVFMGGALYGIPVVIDGFISAVAALVAESLVPGCREYLVASHMGRERGMEPVLSALSLKPVISADLALGEGTGAVMLFPMLDMAISLYLNGTTFEDTVIEKYERFEK